MWPFSSDGSREESKVELNKRCDAVNSGGIKDGDSATTTTVKTAAVATATGVVATKAATAGLGLYGFKVAGVAAGSYAAAAQSAIGNVVAGSFFASCQTLGATGGFAILGPVGLGAAAIGSGVYLGMKYYKNPRTGNSAGIQ